LNHLPGDVVQVVTGQSLLARTRPGPGSLRRLALRDPTPTAVVVRVLQRSPFGAPGVLMGADFDEVFLDGEPWACFDGRLVTLPDRAGTWTVTTRRHGGEPSPHVLSTGAVLEHCAFDPETRELVLVAAADPTRPPELPYTAVLAGPRPRSVDGGELVAEQELRYAKPADRAAAAAAGVVVRFRPGIVRVSYGP
jgi:hypothetical protein